MANEAGSPLNVTETVSPCCVPYGLLITKRSKDDFYRSYGSRQLRQLFLHVPLTKEETSHIRSFLAYCAKTGLIIPEETMPLVPRVVFFNFRRSPEEFCARSASHLQVGWLC
ncbi:MAG: hypothetical protein KVP17_000026 [Porospora cf. gigantea B]|uniref:uncharacterized protein n=1 Tax=Porospora cf. gigantea B TaxID=2853592 RepID=UPI003571DDD4|nr:MAG: hypothetical protein KVP17_000026 [Porospora cf. gigantea B]